MIRSELHPRYRQLGRLQGVVVLALIGLGLLSITLSFTGSPTASATQAAPDSPTALTDSPAYLYAYQPDTASFITLSLPLNSRPADLSAVNAAPTDRVWFTSPDRNRIGQVIYTSTLDYTTTEYIVPGRPQDIAAAATDVWFTLPAAGQVGHLNPANGGIVTLSLAPLASTLSDLALDSLGQAWVAQRVVDHVNVTAFSTTLGVSTTYVISPGDFTPSGLTIDRLGHVWVGARDADVLWRIDPLSQTAALSVSLGYNRQPAQLASNTTSDHVWAVLDEANALARLPWTPPNRAAIYRFPISNSLPGPLAVDALDRVYVILQANQHLARLSLTPTMTFDDIALPRAGITATAITPGRDNGLWVAAYYQPQISRVMLPVIMRNYDPQIAPYGVQNYWALTPQYGLTRIVESKVSWVRFPVYWSSIEPTNTTPDNYNWAAADLSLQVGNDPSINLIITLAGNPSWASLDDSPVNDPADWQEFVGAMVARYPQVKYWEFYNEPDKVGRFGLRGAEYAAMLQAIYPIVKAANPSAQVVMGGLALDWFIENGGPFDRNFLRDVLANCAGPCFDLANFHYYPAFRRDWETYGRDIIGKANYIRQLLAEYNYVRPLINTETGWPSATNWGSHELQASYVPKVYVRGLVADLPVITWFSLIDSDYSKPGLLDSQLTPRPAYTALRTLVQTMPQPRFVRAIPVTETGSSAIEAYQFSVTTPAGLKRVDVYWYDCPSLVNPAGYPADCDGVAPLRIPVSPIAKIDKLGNRVILDDADDGYRDGYVTLGVLSSPIYIDYQP